MQNIPDIQFVGVHFLRSLKRVQLKYEWIINSKCLFFGVYLRDLWKEYSWNRNEKLLKNILDIQFVEEYLRDIWKEYS